MIFCVKLINIQNLEDNLSVQSNCSKSSEVISAQRLPPANSRVVAKGACFLFSPRGS